MIWILIGYMWLYVHRPFEVWPQLDGLYIERVYMLGMLVYWFVGVRSSWTRNRTTAAVLGFAAAVTVCTLVGAYGDFQSLAVQNWYKILPFYFLVLSSVRDNRDFRMLVVGFTVIVGFYELHSLREYLCGRVYLSMGVYRMGGVDQTMRQPNSFAATCVYALPMLFPLFTLAQRRWHYLLLAGSAVLSITCVLLTGSRTGFVGLVILAAGACMASRYRWKVLPAALLIVPIVWFSLSDRMQNRYLTLVDSSRGPANAKVSADSREEFFFIAVDIWKKYPVFGVGPDGFKEASGANLNAHSLYGEVIADMGLVGVAAILFLVFAYLQNFFDGQRLYAGIPHSRDIEFAHRVLVAVTAAVALKLILGFGGDNLFRYTWLWYAAFSALALRFLTEYSCEDHSQSEQEAVSVECLAESHHARLILKGL